MTSLDMAGTFAWAAPELLLGARCTEKVDVRTPDPGQLSAAACTRSHSKPDRCTESQACSRQLELPCELACGPHCARPCQSPCSYMAVATLRLKLCCPFSLLQIFSFGVVLWEIVTGERPLRGQTRELRCVLLST